MTGVLAARPGPGGTCSAAGSAIDALFYGSLLASAALVALRFAVEGAPAEGPPPAPRGGEDRPGELDPDRAARDTDGP